MVIANPTLQTIDCVSPSHMVSVAEVFAEARKQHILDLKQPVERLIIINLITNLSVLLRRLKFKIDSELNVFTKSVLPIE